MKRGLWLLIFAMALLSGCGSSEKKAPTQMPQVTAGNQSAARMRLIAISKAEDAYAVQSGGNYGTLDQLIENQLLRDSESGKLQGYKYEVKVKPGGGFEATAVPNNYGVTGNLSYYIDETRQIRGADRKGEPATAADPEL